MPGPPPPEGDGIPPPPYSQQPPPYTQAPPPGYGPSPGFEQPAPRPDAKVGGSLIVAGAIVTIIGVFLPWLDTAGQTRNGMDVYVTSDFTVWDSPGSLMIGISAIVGGLGVALFLAGRVLAVAIIAIVMSAIAVFMGLGMMGIIGDVGGGGDFGIGVILQPIAPLASVAGSIVVTAKRRR